MKRKLFRPERALKTALVYLLVLLVSFLFAFPCVWLVLSAFKSTTIRGGSATPSSWRR